MTDPIQVTADDIGKEFSPGVRLRNLISGPPGRFGAIAWSPNGQWLAAICAHARVEIYDAASGVPIREFKGAADPLDLAWAPGENSLVAFVKKHRPGGSQPVVLDVRSGKQRFVGQARPGESKGIQFSSDGRFLATLFSDREETVVDCYSVDGPVIQLPSVSAGVRVSDGPALRWHPSSGRLACLLSDGWMVVEVFAGEQDNDVAIRSWELLETRMEMHENTCLSWSPGGDMLAIGHSGRAIEIHDPLEGLHLTSLEGHTGTVYGAQFSSVGGLFASADRNGFIHLRLRDTWQRLASIPGPDRAALQGGYGRALAFHPTSPQLVSLNRTGEAICIWDLDLDALIRARPSEDVLYTTARIALVGDTMVGKTHLGQRIKTGVWGSYPSTHGQQFWIIEELCDERKDGTRCEAVLWDFAGQHDYRLVHALFLDDVDLALVLFDPSHPTDPLKGVDYWLRQLAGGDGPPQVPSVLVATKLDTGSPSLTGAELDTFCRTRGIAGGYVGTSANTGQGVDELLDRIRDEIDWDRGVATVTTRTFKRIKDFVLELKEKASDDDVLVRPLALRSQLEADDEKGSFQDAEMMTAVGHLANHGYVSVLRGSDGSETILLAPDRLVNLAASMVLEARRNPEGLGSLEEGRVRDGDYDLPELDGFDSDQRKVLLDAVTRLFLVKNVCFRERDTAGLRNWLVFPELINLKKPLVRDEAALLDDVTYEVTGAVSNVYAALVVLLGYSGHFSRRDQWQNQAQYSMDEGEVCGFKQIQEHEGQISLVLYYDRETPGHARQLFQGLFEALLRRRRGLAIRTYPPVDCPHCGLRQPREAVVRRIRKGSAFLRCDDEDCDRKIPLGEAAEAPPMDSDEHRTIHRARAQTARRTLYEAALVPVLRVAENLRADASRTEQPTSFLSYAWDSGRKPWVADLASHLAHAGLNVRLDQWHSPPGTSTTEFVEEIATTDSVLLVGTPELLAKWSAKDGPAVVRAEIRLIGQRLMGPAAQQQGVIPLLLEGEPQESLPPILRDQVFSDFRDDDTYFAVLFDLVLRLHGIPYDHPGMIGLRESLRSL